MTTPARPLLRPGAAVLRRDAGHLQVGTGPGIVVADRPGLHRLLLRLDGRRDPAWLEREVPEIAACLDVVLTELCAAGAVVDASGWDLDAEGRHLAASGHDPRTMTARTRLRVSLHHDGGTLDLVELARSTLRAAGVAVGDHRDPDLLVVVCTGEPSRASLEEAVGRRLAHLLVRVDENRVHVGPLVRPGITPCVQCHDLHRIDWDPSWAALVPQLGRRAAQHNPPALGTVLPLLAVAELVRTVLDVAGEPGGPPAGITTLGPGPDDRRTTPSVFHHRCPCALLPALCRPV